MTFLSKLGVTTIAAGAITLGAMTYWNGGTAIDSAIQKIEEQASKISIFSQNEEKLVGEIEKLVAERNDLVEQLSDKGLKEQKIIELQNELSTKNSEISELQSQLENADSNGEKLAERIDALTVELQKANADAERLQAEVDKTESVEPMTAEEIELLIGGETTPEEPSEQPEEQPEEEKTEYIELTYTKGQPNKLKITEGIEFYFSSPNYKILNQTDQVVKYQIEGSEEWQEVSKGQKNVEGINGQSTNLLVMTLPDGTTYRINVIQN